MRWLLNGMILSAFLAAADHRPPARLDRSALGARTFDEEFDRPLDLFDPVKNPHGRWSPFYWFGYRPGGACVDASCRQVGAADPTIASDPAFNGVEACAVRQGWLQMRIGRADAANPKNAGKPYTACIATTESSHAQRYGYFEARMTLPAVRGAWPAFWLLAKDRGARAQREIDVFEGQGDQPAKVLCTAHWADGGADSSTVSVRDTGQPHVYGVLWSPREVVWYIDDIEVKRTLNKDLDAQMYLIVSMGLGGWDANRNPDQAHIVGASARIDWVRAYAAQPG